MSGTKLFLDTNIILYLLNGDTTIADFIDGKQLYISFISELELLGYKGLNKMDRNQIESFLDDCSIINITEQIKEKTITLRTKYSTKLPDSIIAATCYYLDIPLITADSGFNKIEEIDVLIYELDV